MSQYSAVITWSRGEAVFTDGHYSRVHRWSFDGGVDVRASASPHVVPLPYSVVDAVDPEEAFVASLASCHMLWFLSIAAGRNFTVEEYQDPAVGVMAKNEAGKLAMTRVTLRPRVTFVRGHQPSAHDYQAMHDEAHERCFIATSVKTQVLCEPVDMTEDQAPR